MYNSLLLHIEHDALTGISHHHGRQATLAAQTLGKVDATVAFQGLKVHKLAGKAKHRVSTPPLVRSPICSTTRDDLLQEAKTNYFSLYDLDPDVFPASVPPTTSTPSATSSSCLGSALPTAPTPGSPRVSSACASSVSLIATSSCSGAAVSVGPSTSARSTSSRPSVASAPSELSSGACAVFADEVHCIFRRAGCVKPSGHRGFCRDGYAQLLIT